MTAVKVSILIPVFNRKRYIADCIQSALDQTFTDHEIVVVDNASDDGTWEICQQFASRDPRVRVFRNEENIGPVRNWICCAQQARGEYSKILFSDDLLEPNCVERMLAPLENPEVGFVSCAARIGESKEESSVFYSLAEPALINQKKYISRLTNNCLSFSPGAVLLRTRDLIKNLHTDFPTTTKRNFGENGAGPDVMIMLLTILSYPFAACIGEPLVFFRVHGKSFSIMNTNNEISMGYTSAISYFLRKNLSWYHWLNYVARAWLISLRSQGEWINPFIFLREHEGSGSMREIVMASIVAPFLIGAIIVSRGFCGRVKKFSI